MRKHLALFTTIALALALRLIVLALYGDFWIDELFSVTYSQKPWLDSLRFWTWETNPPLHLLFLKFWFYIFPTTELFARLPSVILGTLAVIPLYKLGELLFNKRVAILAGLLLALSPYHLFISSTARGYALLVFLSAYALLYTFIIVRQEKVENKKWWILAVFNLGLLYTHLTGGIILVAEAIIILLSKKSLLRTWLISTVTILPLWLIWATTAFISKASRATVSYAWFFHILTTPQSIVRTISQLFLGTGAFLAGSTTLVAVLVGVIMAWWKQKKSGEVNRDFLLLTMLVAFPVSAIALLGLWNIKFLVCILPITTLLAAFTINELTKNKLLQDIIIALLIAPGLFNFYKTLPIENWSSINAYVEARHDSTKREIFIYNSFADRYMVEYHLKSDIQKLPYYPFENNYTNWDYNLITKNYWRFEETPEKINSWLDTQNIDAYDRVFIMQNETNGKIDIATTLEARGWKQIDATLNTSRFSETMLYTYDHP